MRRRRLMAAAVAVVVLAALVAGGASVTSPHGPLGLVGAWRDADGTVLPDGRGGGVAPLVVRTFAGAAHCSEDSVIFLELAWPPGTVIDSNDSDAVDPAVRTYVRDPDGVLRDTPTRPFGKVDAFPGAGVDTGFHRWGSTVTVDPDGDAYVTRLDGSIERWPRIIARRGCD